MTRAYASALGKVRTAKPLGSLQEQKPKSGYPTRNRCRPLSDEQVRQIRKDLEVMRLCDVARKHGKKYGVIRNIKDGITYADVE